MKILANLIEFINGTLSIDSTGYPAAVRTLLKLRNNGPSNIEFYDADQETQWKIGFDQNENGDFEVSWEDVVKLLLDQGGTLTVNRGVVADDSQVFTVPSDALLTLRRHGMPALSLEDLENGLDYRIGINEDGFLSIIFMYDGAGDGDWVITIDDSGAVVLPSGVDARWGTVRLSGDIRSTDLPTSDPLVSGRLWRDGGDVRVSTGSSVNKVVNHVGEIITFAGASAPAGFIDCDGQLLLIASYPQLYTAIGTVYGGDGVVDFAVPDLRGRFPIGDGGSIALGDTGGSATVTLTEAQMPTHTHLYQYSGEDPEETTPINHVETFPPLPGDRWIADSPTPGLAMSSETLSTSGGGESHDNMPPYVALRYLIYAGV